MKKLVKIPPLIALPHYHIAALVNKYKPGSIVDMGGRGRLKHFVKCKVLDANLTGKPKIDALNMPFADNAFDIAVSVNTLEHVADHLKFLVESYRVAKKALTHFFLCGPAAGKVEKYKVTRGHKHQHVLPQEQTVKAFFRMHKFKRTRFYKLMTCREHLLLLMTMFPYMQCSKTYQVAEALGNKAYGYILFGEK